MKGEWCYFKSYFSKEICQQIINDAKDISASDAVIGVNGGIGLDKDYRRSSVKFLTSNNQKFEYLFDAMWKTVQQANRDWFDIQISKLDYIQLAEYDSTYKGEYKEHHDVFWMNNDPYYHRKITAVVQLSDPATYTGGELELTEGLTPLPDEIKEQGTIIFFPSLFRHKANPVTQGVRYSLAAWFDGPKWR